MTNHPPSASHQPGSKPPIHRFSGDGYIPASDAPQKAEVLKDEKPEVLAQFIAECERWKVDNVSASKNVIARWIRQGAELRHLKSALDESRTEGCKPWGEKLVTGYVDAIITRIVDLDRKQRAAAKSRFERTQACLAEQRAWVTAAMPSHLVSQRKPELPGERGTRMSRRTT